MRGLDLLGPVYTYNNPSEEQVKCNFIPGSRPDSHNPENGNR